MIPAIISSVAAEEPGIHIVKPGEYIWKIAISYGLSATDILNLNPLENPNLIYPDQRLVIPTEGAQASPPPVRSIVQNATTSASSGWFASPFRVSAYCLQGIMSNGRWVHHGAVAADASIFRLGTALEIEGMGNFVVEDRFGWDAGQYRLDVWMPNCWQALQHGVRYLRVRTLG